LASTEVRARHQGIADRCQNPNRGGGRRADEKKPADRIQAFGKTGYSPKERGRMKLPIIVLQKHPLPALTDGDV
jgi:hypothetical protein